ncbi:MAG: hypothetical protein O3C17_22870, partial [Planctomycetota bacterium]|nr:hypothetical protein [Planctomycetota bacterium]
DVSRSLPVSSSSGFGDNVTRRTGFRFTKHELHLWIPFWELEVGRVSADPGPLVSPGRSANFTRLPDV